MEFYDKAKALVQTSKAFQFPTGWNSTFGDTIMSFDALKFQFPTGWNSTLTGATKEKYVEAFQFPTGWNSTKG